MPPSKVTRRRPTQAITAAHRRLGFIPDPVPQAWTHLPLMRTSERSSFTRCRMQWNLGYLERLSRLHKGNALQFGTLVHTALERYYPPGKRRGPHPAASFLEEYDRHADELGYDFGLQDEDEEWQNARELGEEMLTNYVDHWKKRDKAWRIIAPEVPAMVVVLSKSGKPMCRYLMQLDLVVWDEQLGRHLFVDHKTAKSLYDPEEKVLDEQCGTYWLFGPEYLKVNKVIKGDTEIRGFLYNVLRKAKADPRPKDDKGRALNKDGSVSKRQPTPLFQRFDVPADADRRANVLDRIRKQVYEMDLVRRGKLGVYKVPYFGGVGACTMCEFYNICVLQEDGADFQSLIDLDYRTDADRYEQYRDILPINEE